jgi:rRNA-processing protein FCF1
VPDANLLLVYAIGRYSPQAVARFKRTQAYSEKDFALLVSLFGYFPHIVTTPNILTEVCNLAAPLNRQVKNSLFQAFRMYILDLDEKYISSKEGGTDEMFNRFGLTDSVIRKLAGQGYLILTQDLPLYLELERQRIPVINFNHVRGMAWRGSPQ